MPAKIGNAAISAVLLGSLSIAAIKLGSDTVFTTGGGGPAVPQELGASPGAHRYWRIRGFDNSGGAAYIGWSQIEFRETVGGADVTGSGTPSATTPIQAGSAASVFNNSPTTDIIQWQIGGGFPNNETWVAYDFGSGVTKDIKEVYLTPNKDFSNRTPRNFNVEYSDNGTDWKVSWSIVETAWTIGVSKTYARPTFATAMRRWRLHAGFLISGATMSAAEVEMRGTVGGADLCTGGTASAVAEFDAGTVASRAFDNNTATTWSSSNPSWGAMREWLAYDFGSGVTVEINEVAYTARNDGSWQQAMSEGWLESSADGVNWLPRWYAPTNVAAQGGTGIMTRPTTGALMPSYLNKGGTGNRQSFITVTTDALWSGPSPYQVLTVDGSQANSVWFNSGQSGRQVTYDFGVPVLITQATWYQSGGNAQGDWKWRGSNDGSTWTDIGASFTLGNPATQVHSSLHGNGGLYRYYRLQQVSGTTTSSPYVREIDFRIAGL